MKLNNPNYLNGLGSSASEIDGKVIPIDTIALLRAKTVTPNTVWVSGYYTKGDGAFGSNIFEWDSTSTETDNGGTIIKLTSVTIGRYKLKYSNFLSPKWFGAKGGSADDTAVLNVAINYTNQFVKLSDKDGSTYKANNIILNKYANMDLRLSNFNNTDPILCLNGSDINLNSTIIDVHASYEGNTIELDDTKSYSTATSLARIKGEDVQVYNWNGTSVNGAKATAFYMNFTKAQGQSFWVFNKFRSMGCKRGVIVDTSLNGYFTSNKFLHLQIFNFVEKPLYLNAGSGAEISANKFHLEVQPGTMTIDGVKLLGGRFNKRNIVDGEIWDWHYATAGSKKIEDFGYYNHLRHISTQDSCNVNNTTINEAAGYSHVQTKQLNIHTNAQGKSLSGHADNYLSYANLRSNNTITLSHPLNSGSSDYLFSLDTYTNSYWDNLLTTDVRTIEILFNETIVGDQFFVCFDIGGIPSNVKIELYDTSTSTWGTKINITGNRSPIVGRRASASSYSTGDSTCGGIRYTFSNPYTWSNLNDMIGEIVSQKIKLTQLYLSSNKHKIKNAFVDVSTPILLGDLRSSKTTTIDLATKTQTKALKVMSENGTLIGYLPIYV